MTVEERAPGEFYWVLVRAWDGHSPEALPYRFYRAAQAPQTTYFNALAMGVAELRRMPGDDTEA